jgi:prepilin-type N-terminal cleavage/methylation domain-containing protein
MRNLRDQKGFSLIELMIVVVIIGILAAIAIPRFSNISDRARQSEAEPTLRSIANMQEMFRTDEGIYATDLDEIVAADYGLSEELVRDGSRYFDYSTTANNADNTFCAVASPKTDAPVQPRSINQTGVMFETDDCS